MYPGKVKINEIKGLEMPADKCMQWEAIYEYIASYRKDIDSDPALHSIKNMILQKRSYYYPSVICSFRDCQWNINKRSCMNCLWVACIREWHTFERFACELGYNNDTIIKIRKSTSGKLKQKCRKLFYPSLICDFPGCWWYVDNKEYYNCSWVGSYADNHSFGAIGEMLGCTRQNVQQKQINIFKKIKHEFKGFE